MTLNRLSFFFVLLTIISLPFLIHKFIWIARSKQTTAISNFTGKSKTGQIGHVYEVIVFLVGKDTFWFNGNDNILFKQGEKIPVRYQVNNPNDARINIFSSMWGDTLVYGGIPVLILIVIFLDPKIIPLRSRIKLKKKKPFVEILT